MPKFKPLQSQFKPGDRVWFNADTREQFSGTESGPGTIQNFDGTWHLIEWDSGEYSTEKPEWLEIWEE